MSLNERRSTTVLRVRIIACAALVVWVASTQACGLEIACDPAQPTTTCPDGQTCHAERAVCVAPTGDGDGDGDGDVECVTNCEGPLTTQLTNVTLLHIAQGDAYIVSEANGSDALWRVPLNGGPMSAAGAHSSGFRALALLDDDVFALDWWTSTTSYLVSRPLSGNADFEQRLQTSAGNNAIHHRALLAHQGLLYVVDGSQLIRVASDGSVVRASTSTNAYGVVATSNALYAVGGLTAQRYVKDFAVNATPVTIGIVPGEGVAIDFDVVDEGDGQDRLFIASYGAGNPGMLFTMRGDGSDADILSTDLDPVATTNDPGIVLALAADAGGVSWITERASFGSSESPRLYTWRRSTEAITLLTTLSDPRAIAVAGDKVYVTDKGTARVERVDLPD
jgi:hypothetical protein